MTRRRFLATALFAALALWAWNASFLAEPPADARPRLLAHRGVHQRFDISAAKADSCTARMIAPPTHRYLENTLPSMRAAFAAGAEVVELDVHLTPDGAFAVFHDWTLDCRTDGAGVTRETPMATLRTLDVGYGYTADGGAGVGMMPTLRQVLAAMPDKRFLINFKSAEAAEGDALADLLEREPALKRAVFGVYGGAAPTRRVLERIDGLRGYDKGSITACLTRYAALGWSGYVPEPCRDTLVAVPISHAWLLWGWPYRFLARMRDAGSEVILVGPYTGGFSSGIDDPTLLADVPERFHGHVWTNAIEIIGPALGRGSAP